MTTAIKFGKLCRSARQSRGLSLTDTAATGAIDRQSLWKIEHGQRDIRLSTALRLAKLFDISLDKLA